METADQERYHTEGKKEGHGKKMRSSSFGKTEIDGEAWLSGNPHEVETS
jgi:hypothetical protein